ncbi:MAG: hypothetical protein AAGF12_34215 [Myxococcota bacterium]
MSLDVAVAVIVFLGVILVVVLGIVQSRRRHLLAAELFRELTELSGAEKTERGVRFDFGLELWQDFYAGSRKEKLHGRIDVEVPLPTFYVGASVNTTRYRPDLDHPFTARSKLPQVPLTDDSMGRTLYLFAKRPAHVGGYFPYDTRRALARLEHEFDLWSDGTSLVLIATPLGIPGDGQRVRRLIQIVHDIASAFRPPDDEAEVPVAPI